MKRSLFKSAVIGITAVLMLCIMAIEPCLSYAATEATVTIKVISGVTVSVTAYKDDGSDSGEKLTPDGSGNYSEKPDFYDIKYSSGKVEKEGYYTLYMLSGSSDTVPAVTEENLLYIDQVTASADGSVEFKKVYPRELTDSMIVIAGTGVPAQIIATVSVGSSFLLGDLNNDGVVSALDATCILDLIAGGSATDQQKLVGDFNRDGVFSALDATAILDFLVGNK